jgi:hypothetical protein
MLLVTIGSTSVIRLISPLKPFTTMVTTLASRESTTNSAALPDSTKGKLPVVVV